MRSARSGHGLRSRLQPFQGEQARGRGQVCRRSRQDHHEPLHSLHALCAVHDRGGGRAGDLAAVEEIFALQDLLTRLGTVNLDCRQDGAALDPRWGRATYLFNATIAGIERADALLIVGSNPRKEAAVLNARIRKRWRMGHFPIGLIGEQADLTYPYDYLGAGPETLAEVGAGRHRFAEMLKAAERPMMIIGQGALARP